MPQQLEADFLVQYADDIENCGSQLYYSEVVTDVAPFFVELHWHEQDCVEHCDAYAAAMELSTAVVKGIAQCVAPVADPPAASQCTSAAGELSYDEMLRIRASLPQTAAVVHTARPYRSDGVDSYHCRVRIIWPNLLVVASTSKQLRAIAITARALNRVGSLSVMAGSVMIFTNRKPTCKMSVIMKQYRLAQSYKTDHNRVSVTDLKPIRRGTQRTQVVAMCTACHQACWCCIYDLL